MLASLLQGSGPASWCRAETTLSSVSVNRVGEIAPNSLVVLGKISRDPKNPLNARFVGFLTGGGASQPPPLDNSCAALDTSPVGLRVH